MGGNIFEAIGRTNTLSDTTNNLSRNVLDIYKTGAEMQMRERENKIREDAAAREQAKFDIEQKALAQKEADDNAQINYRLSPQYLGAEEEGRAIFDDYMQKNAYANAEGVGKRRDIRLGMNEFFSDKDRAASALRPSVLAKEKLAMQAFEEYNAAQQEGDTAKAEKAKLKYENAYKQALLSRGNYSELDKLMNKEGYTLKTGETRFGPDNQPVATGGEKDNEMTPYQRERLVIERARLNKYDSADKEDKRRERILKDARREVERAYGYSQFLPSAQDPKLIEKTSKAKGLVEDIIDDHKAFGFDKEPTPGKAAQKAKELIEDSYKPKKVTTTQKDAVAYLKGASDRNGAMVRIRRLVDQGWSRESVAAAAKEAGWE